MDSPYAPPKTDVGRPRKHSFAQWALWVCFGVIVLFTLAFGTCICTADRTMKLGKNELEPICTQYLQKIGSKDYSGAYALIGDAGKASVTEERHNKLMSGIMEKLGTIQSREIQWVQTGIDQQGPWGRIVYKTRFQNDAGTIRFEFRKPAGSYQLVGVFFDSPVLSDFITNALSKKP